MIFTMNENKIRKSFHGVSVPNYTIILVVASGNDVYDWVQQKKGLSE